MEMNVEPVLFVVAAIRIRSPEFTDDAEGRGLSVMRSVVDVFSCSYGPIDSGYKMGGMGPMARGALQAGVKHVSAHPSNINQRLTPALKICERSIAM